MQNFFDRQKTKWNVRLNTVQKQAVLQTEGPLLLLACPGSGKTTTMIMRIGYLIEEKNVNPHRIKAITFSRASAKDMKERFTRFFPDLPPVDFSTIHSLAFAITRTYLQKKQMTFDLIEGNTKNRSVKNKSLLLKELYQKVMQEECTEDELASLTTFISSVKNKMIPPSKWPDADCPFPKAGQIAERYEKYKFQQKDHWLLDFDDMLMIAEQVMRKDKKLAKQFRQAYDYICTDESQDTSLIQHRLVEHLAAEHRNLCVVADDDQSIYTWRGAEPGYLLQFKKVYPEAKILMMEQNYRSSKEIVETAAVFIQRNTERYEKAMFTKNPSKEKIHIVQLDDVRRQLDYVIYELLDEKNLKETAILFRNHSSSTLFVNELHRRGIPFYMKDADDRFFSHWIIEDILNFMRLSFNMERKDIFSKIIFKMNAFISRSMLQTFNQNETAGNVFTAFIETVPLQAKQVEKLKEYKAVYDKFQDFRPAQIIRMIRYELEYEESLKSRAEKFGYRADVLLKILDTLEGIAVPLKTMVEFAQRLQELEKAVQQAKFDPPENAVTLSTFHSAKGLEFKRVFMIDLLEGIIPSEEDKDHPAMLEEARRLFYVGMTRAKERLELLSYRQADGKTKSDSKFVNEIRGIITKPLTEEKPIAVLKKDVPLNPNGISSKSELNEGDWITHRVFGRGKIVKLQEPEICILFGKTEKKLSLEMVLSRRLLQKVPL